MAGEFYHWLGRAGHESHRMACVGLFGGIAANTGQRAVMKAPLNEKRVEWGTVRESISESSLASE
jgi:hypothetical protein